MEFPNTKTICILQQTELAILYPRYGCMHCLYIMALTLMKSNTQMKKLKFAYVITNKKLLHYLHATLTGIGAIYIGRSIDQVL